MRPLLISTSDSRGGASIAAWRLHMGLRAQEVDSTLLISHSDRYTRTENHAVKDSQPQANAIADNVYPAHGLRRRIDSIRGYADQIPLRLYIRRSGLPFSTTLFSGYPDARISDIDYDILHLHWINTGFIHPRWFQHARKPLVWTCHDAWPMTGGCHIIGECTRYMDCCGSCPVLGSNTQNDLSRWVWKRKKRAWQDITPEELTLIAPSRWMADRISESALLGRFPVHVIPNGIDITQYKPIDKSLARRRMGLPEKAPVILFGAVNAVSDSNKGYTLLESALAEIHSDYPEARAVVFGSDAGPANIGGIPAYYTGPLRQPDLLVQAYSAADVMCVPSRQESFGLTAAEAMACGTAVVAFATSGLLDIVDHRRNGYLATPFDAGDFARGIRYVLDNPKKSLSMKARKKIEANFDMERVVRIHKSLYADLLDRAQ
ncbi:MAG: glycosyltransferase [Leptospiraceae bacterium]|nr:glycosyltransferase [Leptospiraceae bacterium]MCB1321833.1 glycosyltransferase [Leptospiraceae bacterium]